jgi:hypothetical protein
LCLADTRCEDTRVEDEVVSFLADRCLRPGLEYPEVPPRSALRRVMGQLRATSPGERFGERVIKALDDGQRFVSAADAAGALGLRKAVPRLARAVAARDTRSLDTLAAIEALGEIGGLEATAALRAAERDHPDPVARNLAAWTLCLPDAGEPLGGPPAPASRVDPELERVLGTPPRSRDVIVEGLVSLVRDHPVGDVRERAAAALGQLGAREALPALLAALDATPPPHDGILLALWHISEAIDDTA